VKNANHCKHLVYSGFHFLGNALKCTKTLTAEGIRRAYFGIEETGKTILQVFGEHNERCKSLIGIDFAGTYSFIKQYFNRRRI